MFHRSLNTTTDKQPQGPQAIKGRPAALFRQTAVNNCANPRETSVHLIFTSTFSSVFVLMLTTAAKRVWTRGGVSMCAQTFFQCMCVVPSHGGRLKAPRADCQLHQLYSKVSELPELQITADYRAGCSYTFSV